MTLLEALQSGRPFRREGENKWYIAYRNDICWIGNSTYIRRSFGHKIEDDLKAKDFELKDIFIPEYAQEQSFLSEDTKEEIIETMLELSCRWLEDAKIRDLRQHFEELYVDGWGPTPIKDMTDSQLVEEFKSEVIDCFGGAPDFQEQEEYKLYQEALAQQSINEMLDK
jgi:hypothetical protein